MNSFGGFVDFLVAGFIGVVILAYLAYALFNPEKF